MIKPNEHVLDYLDAYLHKVLKDKDVALLEEHCASCRVCQVALEEARKRFDALESLPVLEVSDQLLQATQAKIDRYKKRNRKALRFGGAFMLASFLTLIGFHVYYATLTPSGYDMKVLGQRELIAGSEASLRVVLVEHSTGKALKNVPVTVSLTDKSNDRTFQLVQFTTNESGSASPRFRLPRLEKRRVSNANLRRNEGGE